MLSFSCTCSSGYAGDGFACPPCAAGSYREAGTPQTCLLCPAGTASAFIAQTSAQACQACAAGVNFSPTRGAAACTPVGTCQAGSYVSGFPTATSDKPCSPCVLGVSFSTASNAAQCTPVSTCDVASGLKCVLCGGKGRVYVFLCLQFLGIVSVVVCSLSYKRRVA